MPARVGKEFYDTAVWQKLRKAQLQAHPLCQMCLQLGRIKPATTVDHIVPHKGNWTRFHTRDLQSLCAHCHESTKKEQEHRGYSTQIGVDGRPVDHRHPYWTGKVLRDDETA